MDTILCEELLQEIFHRLPPLSSSAVSLVSKRWLRLYRLSKTSLSLRLSPHNSSIPSLSSFLSHYPYLSSLSLTPTTTVSGGDTSTFSDHLLLSVAFSCPHLRNLRLLIGPVSFFSLLSLSTSCPHLTSLAITLSRPLSFHWLLSFLSLKDLSVVFTGVSGAFDSDEFDTSDAELSLENLSLSGTRAGDYSLNWLWRSCKKLRRLQLRSCEGIGDAASVSSFVKCLNGLQEVELRTCRTIVARVLLKLAENCISLNSLLVYDGGSKEGLLQFISLNRCNLQKIDLRLPLDLHNNHLLAMAENFRGLSTLRLQSCCFITGEGLKTLGIAMSNVLEELALINCDVIKREPGLLTTLGQNLRRLRKLDLSHNEMLVDKELISMLVSCNNLSELKLRGCKGLTNVAVVSMFSSCKHLESVDIRSCCGIEAEAIELFVLNSHQLKRIQVEEDKLSDVARMWALNKFIEVVV
uniref:Putative F-box/LRR-repeat protein 3 n=1 Tax=Davidia involucrata TaxID=16924 RepID=A0A5B6YU71_DAVIN